MQSFVLPQAPKVSGTSTTHHPKAEDELIWQMKQSKPCIVKWENVRTIASFGVVNNQNSSTPTLMKRLFSVTLVVAGSVLFFGCPTGLDYALGVSGAIKVKNELLGTWYNDDTDGEVLEMEIVKKSDYIYEIHVIEQGTTYFLDSDTLTGWIVPFEGRDFFVFQPQGEEKYYHYVVMSNSASELILMDMSLLVGGVDVVTSTPTLQAEVRESMKKTEFFESEKTYFSR